MMDLWNSLFLECSLSGYLELCYTGITFNEKPFEGEVLRLALTRRWQGYACGVSHSWWSRQPWCEQPTSRGGLGSEDREKGLRTNLSAILEALSGSCQTTVRLRLLCALDVRPMPRKKNLQCQRCATESLDFAQAQPCWVSKTCRARRSYYRHRATNLSKKRTRQRTLKAVARADGGMDVGVSDETQGQVARANVEVVDFPLLGHVEPPEVSMVFYRDRADGPIHAVEFCVTENGQLVKKVKPKHLKGVPQRQLRVHIKQVIGLLKAEFGDELLVSEARQPVRLCPLCAEDGKRR